MITLIYFNSIFDYIFAKDIMQKSVL